MSTRRLLASVFLLSAAGLGYEVALTRILSIAEWHHFAYMIISVALLGFAASGTAVALLGRRLRGREATLYRAAALLLAVALPGSHALVQVIPFETFELLVRRGQFVWLLMLYGALAVPFFLLASCVLLAFVLESERVGRVYFANMSGSGVGAAAVTGLLFVVAPDRLPFLLAFVVLAGGALAAPLRTDRVVRWVGGLAVSLGIVLWIGAPAIRISQYKGLSYALDLPDARVVATAESPLSSLTAVSSPLIRETPGQISGYPMGELGELPEQIGLYFDGDGISPVHRFGEVPGDPSRPALERFAFLDYVTPALPYQLLAGPRSGGVRVAVVGAGGGTEVWNALVHGATHVTALEVDRNVFRLVRGPLGEFAGGLYDRPDVTAVAAEARGWLRARADARFDLIQISLLDSFNASAAGVRALSESYLYTLEAVELYLDRLTATGVLSVTRWLRAPPRDAIKMFATLVEAAERAGIADPGRHMAFVRSWNTGTILLSRSPLSADRIARVRAWAGARGLDLDWLPGLEASEVNRFTVLEQPVYWEAARRILSPDRTERERFYTEYPFHVRPATDDRPYFFRFFKWGSIARLQGAVAGGWVNVTEWGYLVLLATLAQAVIAGLLVVLAPLLFVFAWRRRRGGVSAEDGSHGGVRGGEGGPGPSATRVVLYFAALGLAYLSLEIAFIQKLMLFLVHPVYAVAVVLSAFLIFSGLGSAVADRLLASRSVAAGAGPRAAGGWHGLATPGRLVGAAVVLIGALTAIYLALLPGLFAAGSGWPDAARICAGLAVLAPLAFVMGVPFPTGLQVVSVRRRELVPWAWGVNGAASVVAPPLATVGAVHAGFTAVVAVAVILYALAWAVVIGGPRRWSRMS